MRLKRCYENIRAMCCSKSKQLQLIVYIFIVIYSASVLSFFYHGISSKLSVFGHHLLSALKQFRNNCCASMFFMTLYDKEALWRLHWGNSLESSSSDETVKRISGLFVLPGLLSNFV